MSDSPECPLIGKNVLVVRCLNIYFSFQKPIMAYEFLIAATVLLISEKIFRKLREQGLNLAVFICSVVMNRKWLLDM